MNNNNKYTPYNSINPNKKKKCSCEDKYGPKPFTNTSNQPQNSNKPN